MVAFGNARASVLRREALRSPERRPENLNQSVFQPLPFSPALGEWVLSLAGLEGQSWRHMDFYSPESANEGRHGVTIWTPPPECCRQVITTYLHMWVQVYQDTSAAFLVPRALQKQWGRISRYVEDVGIVCGPLLPEACRFNSYLPFVVLCIRPAVPLHRPRLVNASMATPKDWHYYQAEAVRGL